MHMKICHVDLMWASCGSHVVEGTLHVGCVVTQHEHFGDQHEPRILGGIFLGYAGTWTPVEIMWKSCQ